jgi:hypothetical protein
LFVFLLSREKEKDVVKYNLCMSRALFLSFRRRFGDRGGAQGLLGAADRQPPVISFLERQSFSLS